MGYVRKSIECNNNICVSILALYFLAEREYRLIFKLYYKYLRIELEDEPSLSENRKPDSTNR